MTNQDAIKPNQPGRRRYDSPLRRRKAAETRECIVVAGAALVHTFQSWDWRELTFRAVAERAGVGESTVYRHFANEGALHDAVMQRLHEQAGVTYEGIALEEVADVAGRVFASLSSFAVSAYAPDRDDPSVTTADQTRRQALIAAVEAAAPGMTAEERRGVAGMLDVLWSVASYERLIVQWDMTPERATDVISKAISLVVDNVRG